MRWLSVAASLAVCSPSMAYDFHDRNATPAQIAEFEKAMRGADPNHPEKGLAEHALRRNETLRETAFRHMVQFCENLDEEQDDATSNAAVARCNAAGAYYRTIRDDKDVPGYDDPSRK